MSGTLRLVGQTWLRQRFELPTPSPAVDSYVGSSARKTTVLADRTTEIYPLGYAVDDTLEGHLRFALRYEPLDMGVVASLMAVADANELADWVRREPTGQFARRAWFLYEHFTGKTLDVASQRTGNWVSALDDSLQIAGPGRRSPRHRVHNNLLGTPRLCLTVRKSEKVKRILNGYEALRNRIEAVVGAHDASMLQRASYYLYTKETRSTFAIEHERPTPKRAERFMHALRDAHAFEPTAPALTVLQQTIVDPRYAATDYRDMQSFVGEIIDNYRPRIHFICPKPADLADLMQGFMDLFSLASDEAVDPIVAAAIVSFAFVFIHPFEDGNGRIHRFLLHAMLGRRGLTPDGVLFPISAVMERERKIYDEVLESFSHPLFEFINWTTAADDLLEVHNVTAHLYRYFDATVMAEYIYDCVIKTIDKDLIEELDYLERFDHASRAVRDIVDMPDKRLGLLVKLMLHNGGKLSATKREHFAEITDAELAAMEAGVRDIEVSR